MQRFLFIVSAICLMQAVDVQAQDQMIDRKVINKELLESASLIPGVKGDGIFDDTEGIQALLDSKAKTIYLPAPQVCYKISKTLKIYSNQTLVLDRNATIRLADGVGVHMITNSDHTNGNSRITVIGGIWDGNNLTQKQEYHETGNDRPPFDPNRFLGVLMQFNNVTDLQVSDLTLKDPETYGFQGGNLLRFTVENITFDYNLKRGNMDGIHIHGNSHQGRILNLKGTTSDDMVALNADDVPMFEMSRGAITDIEVDGVWAYGVHRFVRLLSHGSPIKRIHVSNLYGTYEVEGVALTKLKYDTHPGEKSTFENITFSGIYCSNLKKGMKRSQIRIQEDAWVSDLVIDNFHRVEEKAATDNIYVEKGANVDYLSVTNSTLLNRSDGMVSFIKNLGNIEVLHLTNVYMKKDGEQTVVRLLDNQGLIGITQEVNVSIK